MMLKCQCGHLTDEGTLELREYCKGCGLSPEDDTEAAWDKFLNTFEDVDDDGY